MLLDRGCGSSTGLVRSGDKFSMMESVRKDKMWMLMMKVENDY